MPIMTRMRDSMPVILFGLLIAFLITIVFEWGMDYLGIRGGQSDTVGKINGAKVSYKEFSEVVKSLSDNAKAQSGQEPDEATLRQIRDQAWQSILNERLVNEEVKRLGITVTDQELRDWVFGENPPEDLRRNFTDSTGRFNKEMYDQVLANPNQYIQDPRGEDPNYGVKRLQEFEKSLRQRRIQEKLQSVVASAVRVSDGELRQKFADQSQRYEALFAMFDPNALIKDADVATSDADLREYYEENVDQYKVEATRKLKYVQFAENPTAADSAARETEIRDAAAKASAGIDFLQLVYTYGDRPDSGAYFRRGELSPVVEKAVYGSPAGSVIGPVADNDGFHLFKVLEERKSAADYIHASHILFLMSDGDTMAVRATAQSVAKLARGGKDFAELARQYSKDPSSAERGGDLGWFTKGRMVTPFETAIFGAKAGEIVGPIRTNAGLHIVKVFGHDNREVKLAHIDMKIAASSQTKNDLADRAKDFGFNARENDFSKEAQQTGLEVKETQVLEKGGVVPGIGINESITRWAFGARVGAVSEPYTLANGYAVLTVVESKNAGVRPFDEVKESIQPLALRKKKLEAAKKKAADARAQLSQGDSLSKIGLLAPGVTVQSTGPFTLASSIVGVGRDQAFLGAVAGLRPGQISAAVAGTRGAYLIQLLSRAEFDSVAFAMQKDQLLSRSLQEKRSRFISDWLAKLKENADIEDHRDVFFR
jgi:peptidyl-prolyl cis-trans isomerase D